MLEPQNISKLSSRWRVLPLDHLSQAIWIRFDPLDTMTPSCRTQQQCRQQQWTCHTVPCGCINWINIFKFWTLFECLETQTQAHFLEMLTTLCMLEKKKKKWKITHLSTGQETCFWLLVFLSVFQHWHRCQRTKRTRPSEASLPVLWENCNDRPATGLEWNSVRCLFQRQFNLCTFVIKGFAKEHTCFPVKAQLTKHARQSWDSNGWHIHQKRQWRCLGRFP